MKIMIITQAIMVSEQKPLMFFLLLFFIHVVMLTNITVCFIVMISNGFKDYIVCNLIDFLNDFFVIVMNNIKCDIM